jgi:uncharacterized membrane protein YeiB
MLVGIALLGVVTANLAAFLMERDAVTEPDHVVEKHDLAEVVALLHDIRTRLSDVERRDGP